MAEYDFEPDYKFWWKKKSVTKEEFIWMLLGIDPEAARKAVEIGKTAESKKSDEERAYYSRFEYLTFIQRRRYSVLMRLNWDKGKEGFIRDVYEDAHEFPDKLVLFLKSVDKMPHNPNLERYKEHDQYKADLDKWELSDIKDEDAALSLILGLNPKFFNQFLALHNRQVGDCKTGVEAQYYASFSPEEKWLFSEYYHFLRSEFPTLGWGSPINPLNRPIHDAKCFANWKGNFQDYVQELHDNGVLFRPETYAALQKQGIPLSYTENGWAMQFNRRWIRRQGAWSLKTAAKIYLGEHPDGTDRGFIILGYTGLHGAGEGLALESSETIAEYDSEGKFVHPSKETLNDVFSNNQESEEWYILENFVRGHIPEKLTPKNDDGPGKLYFQPKVIVEFFRDYLPRTYQPKALYIALGLDEKSEQTHANQDIAHTGLPGRPSKSKHLLESEFERRKSAGTVTDSLAEEVRTLLAWLKQNHPEVPQPTEKSTQNSFREQYRQYAVARQAA
jgi:hypothetical protein